MNDKLTASEALYGFTSWLTTRKQTTNMGSTHNCAGIPDLVERFLDANNLEQPRNGWHHQLKYPEEAPECG